MDLRIETTTTPRLPPEEHNLGFGEYFTDHMLLLDYDGEMGWHDARIVPYGPLSLDPASVVLHYAQAVFEGLKAYRNARMGVALFRADRHLARLNRSAARLCVPQLPEGFVLEALKALVLLDTAWLPQTSGSSLYIRPTIIATEAALGLYPSRSYTFFAILSPTGPSKQGTKPVKLLVAEDSVRAPRGWLGTALTPANYAAVLQAAQEARARGFADVLWLDAADRRYATDVGNTNIFFRIDDGLLTPPLDGSIVAGITRDCVIQLARTWGISVTERRIAISELVDVHARGALREAFMSGTEDVITPVGQLWYKGYPMIINKEVTGEWALSFFDAISRIQCGAIDDPYGWTTPLEAPARPGEGGRPDAFKP